MRWTIFRRNYVLQGYRHGGISIVPSAETCDVFKELVLNSYSSAFPLVTDSGLLLYYLCSDQN